MGPWLPRFKGMHIDGMTLGTRHNNQTEQDARKAFRDKFKDQIKTLIGKEPRVEKVDEKWTIFYEWIGSKNQTWQSTWSIS